MNRALPALLLVVGAGCHAEPSYTAVAVSPAELRASLPEVSARGATMVHDDHREVRRIGSGATVELAPEPGLARTSMSVGVLAAQCASSHPASPPGVCDLDNRSKHPSIQIETATYWRPEWDKIGPMTLLLLGTGAIVGGEAYCFSKCGTGGKVALVTVDVAALVTAALVVTTVVAALPGH